MRCGCSNGPCDCSLASSDCIGVTGSGSDADPFEPFLVLSDDARQVLECRVDGAYVREYLDMGVVASAAALTLPASGHLVRVTGTTTITSIVATAQSGRIVTLKFDSSLTVTDGSNLNLATSFSATANDTLQLACDGTSWFEISRSNN